MYYNSICRPLYRIEKKVLQFVDMPYVCNPNCENIQIVQLHPSAENVSVKLNITINSDFSAKIYVHRIELDQDHDLWIGLPKMYDSLSNIQSLLAKLTSYSICTGNHEQEFIDLTPVGSAIEHHSPLVMVTEKEIMVPLKDYCPIHLQSEMLNVHFLFKVIDVHHVPIFDEY